MQLFKFFRTENTSHLKTQTAKNGGFFEELLSENDFEAVLVNFCCYMVPMLLRQFRRLAQGYCSGFPIVGGNIITIFFETPPPPPTKTDAPPRSPPLKNEAPIET